MSRRRRTRPLDPPKPAPAGPARPFWLNAALVFSIAIVAAWAWSTSFGGVLLLDDIRAIARNPTIRTLWPVSIPLSPPTASTVAGRPIANLSLAVSYALGDPSLQDLWSFHLLNLVIHVAAAAVLFGIVRRTLTTERVRARFGEPAPSLALLVALVWLVHPLQTESVTYIVQRVESLMGLFYLLTVYCAIRANEGVRTRAWTIGAAIACALGMATKEVMVTAPVTVALWYRVFAVDPAGRRARRNVLIGLATTWVVFIALVLHEHRAPSLDLASGTVWRYLMTQMAVIVHYLRLAFWPSPLVFLYTWPLVTSMAQIAVPATVIGLLVVLTIAGLAKRHPLAFAGAWFFVILAPTSSVIPIATEVAAEHRMYLPLAAVVATVLLSIFALTRTRTLRIVSIGTAATVIVLLGSETRARNRVYWSEEQLWRQTVEAQPDNQRARVAYGSALAAAGRLPDAEAQLRRAVELEPRDGIARARLGTILAAEGRVDEATRQLERALQMRPDDVDVNRVLGRIFASRRQDARAVRHLSRAVEVAPDQPDLLTGLAAILADSRDVSVRDAPRALALAERAVALSGRRDPFALDVLSVAQAGMTRFAEAAATAREALPLARAQGNQALVEELQYRASAYEARAH